MHFVTVNGLVKRELSLEVVESKSPRHGDSVLKVLQELQKLSVSEQNQKRARLFYRFVAELRRLHNSTLGPLVPKMMETSRYFTSSFLGKTLLQVSSTLDLQLENRTFEKSENQCVIVLPVLY